MRHWTVRSRRASLSSTHPRSQQHSHRSLRPSWRSARLALPLVGAFGVAVLVAQVSPLPGALASSLPGTQPAVSRGHAARPTKKALPSLANSHATPKQASAHVTLTPANSAPATRPQTASAPAAHATTNSPVRAAPPAKAPPAKAPQPPSSADTPASPAGSVEPAAAAASGSVQAMIRRVFGRYAGQALNVARCESGFNPSATNRGSGAAGVFQFLRGTWRGTAYARYSPYNAWANINAAHQVFVRDGYSWREWVCKPW